MPERIALAQLKGLLADGVQLVDVLPPEEYAAEHLPGAVNALKQLDAETTAQLDQHRPVAVYCGWLPRASEARLNRCLPAA
jgi:rhodanese-related sulfurtransferase